MTNLIKKDDSATVKKVNRERKESSKDALFVICHFKLLSLLLTVHMQKTEGGKTGRSSVTDDTEHNEYVPTRKKKSRTGEHR